MDSEKQPEGFEGAGLGGWENQVVGIREGTDCMEHWVWCKNNECCYAENKKISKKTKRKLALSRGKPLMFAG